MRFDYLFWGERGECLSSICDCDECRVDALQRRARRYVFFFINFSFYSFFVCVAMNLLLFIVKFVWRMLGLFYVLICTENANIKMKKTKTETSICSINLFIVTFVQLKKINKNE